VSEPEPPDGGGGGGGSLAARLRSLVAALDAAAHRDRTPTPNGETAGATADADAGAEAPTAPDEPPPVDAAIEAPAAADELPSVDAPTEAPSEADELSPVGAPNEPPPVDATTEAPSAADELPPVDATTGAPSEADEPPPVDAATEAPPAADELPPVDAAIEAPPAPDELPPVDAATEAPAAGDELSPVDAAVAVPPAADEVPPVDAATDAPTAETGPAPVDAPAEVDERPPADAVAEAPSPEPDLAEAEAAVESAPDAGEPEPVAVEAPAVESPSEAGGAAPVDAAAGARPAVPQPDLPPVETAGEAPVEAGDPEPAQPGVAAAEPEPGEAVVAAAPQAGEREPVGIPAETPEHPTDPTAGDAVQPALFDAAPVATVAPPPEPEPVLAPAAPPQPALFDAPPPPIPAPAPAALSTGERARRRKRQRRRKRLRTVAFLLTLVVLIAAIPVLAVWGVRTISESNEGRVIEPETDASAPGFEAVVDPTPTLLLAHEDADGGLAGLTILALGLDDEGGDVLFVPTGTMVEIPSFGLDRLSVAFDRGGLDLVRQSSENLLGISFTEAVRIDPARWEELVAPVAPIQVVNPDPIEVVDDDGRVDVAFPAGTIDVTADQVSELLSLESVDETQLARLVRHQAFWEAWLDAVAASPSADAVPGEVSTGLGRFVRGLSEGDVVYETLRVETISASISDGEEAYQADRDAVAAQMSEILPFAAAPEGGDRARVRILNGTGEPGLAQSVTSVLVPAGAEITVVGNADTFDYDTTQVVFYDQAEEAVAERLRDALGVGEVVFSRVPNDAVDVTVVVGSDFEPPAAEDGADEAGSDSTG
jgi:hypothetical protein